MMYEPNRFAPPLDAMTSATNLWGDLGTLDDYDVLLLSCECNEFLDNKGAAAYDAITRHSAVPGPCLWH